MFKECLIYEVFVICLILSGFTLAEDQSTASSNNWLDSGHAYVSNSTDTLADWIDGFFELPRTDAESASTALRLSFENDWEEGEGDSFNVKLRGKVFLPNMNKRLSLVFSDDEEGEASERPEIDEKASTRVGLQYNVRDTLRSRLDFGLGIRSSGKGKAKLRYRYKQHLSEQVLYRFTETLYFVDGEGFGSRTRFDIDRSLEKDRLLRWANHAKYAESIEGMEWSTRLIFGERLNERQAISYFIWVNGETRPDYLTTSYGVGSRFRSSFYRPWLFYELEPAYAWQRLEIADNRQGAVLFTVRLEVQLERLVD